MPSRIQKARIRQRKRYLNSKISKRSTERVEEVPTKRHKLEIFPPVEDPDPPDALKKSGITGNENSDSMTEAIKHDSSRTVASFSTEKVVEAPCSSTVIEPHGITVNENSDSTTEAIKHESSSTLASFSTEKVVKTPCLSTLLASRGITGGSKYNESTVTYYFFKFQFEMCQELYDTIRNRKTEEGRLLCESFIRSPNRRSLADYYKIVTSPIDLIKIHQRLKADAYIDIQQFASDIELLVTNAKSYYKESSQEYQDACKLWKVFCDEKICKEKEILNKVLNAVTSKVVRNIRKKKSYPVNKVKKIRKKELEAVLSAPSEPSSSVVEASPPNDGVEPPLKNPKPVDKVPTPSLVVEGPSARKPAKIWTEAEKPAKPPRFEDYVFEGKRLVNMGYFLRSLKTLNDHGGRKCNFSNMRECAETKDGWNVGIVFTCNLCSTTKVIWMEDPDMEEPPFMPIIFKPKFARNLASLQPIQPLRAKPPAPVNNVPYSPAPVNKVPQPTSNFPVISSPPNAARQPSCSLQKTPTPPPNNDPPPGPVFHSPAKTQMTVQMRELPSYPNQILIPPNTAIRYGPPKPPFAGPLQLQPVVGQQVPTISHSQQPIINQSLIVQSPVPVINQHQGPVISQTQLITQLQGWPQQTIVQSQVPLIDFPQVAAIKEEVILPDDGTNPLLLLALPSSEPARVEMSFCVDQEEIAKDSGTVPSTYAVNVSESFALAPAAFAQTSLRWPQLSLSSTMDQTTNHGIATTDALPVDLNLVKREVDDETVSH